MSSQDPNDPNSNARSSTEKVVRLDPPPDPSGQGQDDEPADHLDLEPEPSGPGFVAETVPYDPAPSREFMRGLIAGGLFGLIALLSLSTLGLLAFREGFDVDAAAKFFGAIVSPVIALSSGVLGFYFGSSQR